MQIFDFIPLLGAISGLIEKLVEKYNASYRKDANQMKIILIEFENNLESTNDYFVKKSPILEVITSLSVDELKYGIKSGIWLNKFQKKSVDIHRLFKNPLKFYNVYDGWTTEKLILNIYKKIIRLKHIVENRKNLSRFNLPVRLNNIRKLTILLFFHLDS